MNDKVDAAFEMFGRMFVAEPHVRCGGDCDPVPGHGECPIREWCESTDSNRDFVLPCHVSYLRPFLATLHSEIERRGAVIEAAKRWAEAQAQYREAFINRHGEEVASRRLHGAESALLATLKDSQ